MIELIGTAMGSAPLIHSEDLPSVSVKDRVLLRNLIESGKVTGTLFKTIADFDLFVRSLVGGDELSASFFMDITPKKLVRFFNYLSSATLSQLKALFEIMDAQHQKVLWLLDSMEDTYEKQFIEIEKASELKIVPTETFNRFLGFSALLKMIIEFGFEIANVYYENFEQFEEDFKEKVIRDTHVFSLLVSSNENKLRNLFAKMKSDTLVKLRVLVAYKYGMSSFMKMSMLLQDLNKRNESSVIVESLIYGIKVDLFESRSFLFFINDRVNNMVFPETFDRTFISSYNQIISHHYVRSFVYFLIYKRYQNEALSNDGPLKALDQILNLKRNYFISIMNLEKNILQGLFNLMEIIPEKQIAHYFNLINPQYKRKWEKGWQIVSDFGLLSKQKFAAYWILLSLRNEQKLELNTIVKMILSESGEEEIVVQKEEVKEQDKTSSMVDRLSFLSIKDGYLARYNIYDLIREVIFYGKFPSWSALYSAGRFYSILIKLANTDAIIFKKSVNDYIKWTKDLTPIISLLGEEKFIQIHRILDPTEYAKSNELAGKLVQAFAALGNTTTLHKIFLLLIVRYKYKHVNHDIQLLLDDTIDQTALLNNLSNSELITIVSEQLSDDIARYIDQKKSNKFSNATDPVAWQGDIDFLLYLLLYRQYPWWASQFDDQGLSLDETIVRLTNQMINEHPKSFVQEISSLSESSSIFEMIIPLLKPKLIDRILLVLSPDHAAFVVNFNILIKRWSHYKNPNEWISFLFSYFSFRTNFDYALFVNESLIFLGKRSSLSLKRTKDDFLKITSEAIREGQMKFLPFMNLFGENELSIPATPIIAISLNNGVRNSLDFTELLTYYLAHGSLPINYSSKAKSYLDFIVLLEDYIASNNIDLRLAIISSMGIEKIRNRVVRNEKEYFLFLLANAVFPKIRHQLFEYKSELIILFNNIYPSLQVKLIDEIFYHAIFRQVLDSSFMNLSASQLIRIFLQQFKIINKVDFDFDVSIYEALHISEGLQELISLEDPEKVSLNEAKKPKVPKLSQKELKVDEELKDQKLEGSVMIKNAGIVIVWPYLGRYFEMLSMTEKGKFKTEQDSIRAVHLIQYLATGESATPEHELVLNKILCGVDLATPIPLQIELTDKEKETSDQMLNGVLQNWAKLKSSSIYALREGFFIRDGFVQDKENVWELEVPKKTLDILLRSLPWGFGTIKMSWMSKRLIVNWTYL